MLKLETLQTESAFVFGFILFWFGNFTIELFSSCTSCCRFHMSTSKSSKVKGVQNIFIDFKFLSAYSYL